MTLDRTGKPCSGSVTRQASLRAAGMVKLDLESCASVLKEALPSTAEALQEQGVMLKVALRNLRRSVFQLEECEPDQIIINGYQLKMADMKEQFAQRVTEINENLKIFGQDPVSLLNATVIEQLALDDGKPEPLETSADGSLHIHTAPPDQTPVDGAACGRSEDLGRRTRDPPPKDNLPPPRVPKKEERPSNEERNKRPSDETETSFTFEPPSASSPQKPADLLRKQPFEYFTIQKEEEQYDDDRGYQKRLERLTKKVPPAETFRGEATTFALWAERLRRRAARTPVNPVDALDILVNYTAGDVQGRIIGKMRVTTHPTAAMVQTVWEELCHKYGNTALVAAEIMAQLDNFPKICPPNEDTKLYTLLDVLNRVENARATCPEIRYMDNREALNPVVQKLPPRVMSSWREHCINRPDVHAPTKLSEFITFLSRQAAEETVANPIAVPPPKVMVRQTALLSSHDLDVFYGLCEGDGPTENEFDITPTEIRTLKTEMLNITCRYCKRNGHMASHCYDLSKLDSVDKREFVKSGSLCFKCLEPGHVAAECASDPKCTVVGCGKPHSPSLYHVLPSTGGSFGRQNAAARGTVPATRTAPPALIRRTQVGDRVVGSDQLICSKTVLVDLTLEGCPGKSMRVYAVLDEQSNATILEDRVLDFFGLPFPSIAYDLIPADAKNVKRSVGRLVSGLRVAGVLSRDLIPLTDVLTIDELADSRDQVATPEIARLHRHVAPYASEFPPFDPKARVSLLIGTNNERALGTQVPFPDTYPLLHQTNLGYALVGKSFSPVAHVARVRQSLVSAPQRNSGFRVTKVSSPENSSSSPKNSPSSPINPSSLSANISHPSSPPLLNAGPSSSNSMSSPPRSPSFPRNSPSSLPKSFGHTLELPYASPETPTSQSTPPLLPPNPPPHKHTSPSSLKVLPSSEPLGHSPTDVGSDIFEQLPDDDELGTSSHDKIFLNIMHKNVKILPSGSIELPLPLKLPLDLPDNRAVMFKRAQTTVANIKKDSFKLEKCREAMQKNIDKHFVEEVPPRGAHASGNVRFYIPVFPVVQSKPFKVDKIRLVYDAAAKYRGMSLNDALYQGPDLTNSLRGVLLRFREKSVAFCADIESMFNVFKVPPQHSDVLRFFWPHKNDFNNDLVEYRALSHVFGCTSSPAVASYGLKYAVHDVICEGMMASRRYIEKSFYVDDGLGCADTVEEAIALLKGAVNLLARRNIRLHKILSNEPDVLRAFPEGECSMTADSLLLKCSPLQTTLGVAWAPNSDCFTMNVSIPEKAFSKRGVLSVINSLYDPLNFVTPIVLGGRLLQRKFIPKKESNSPLFLLGWDDELPSEYLPEWQAWLESLGALHNLIVPRCFTPKGFAIGVQELHVFADASESAIAYVVYLRSVSTDGRVHVAFVSSAAKVAPKAATSMPRLELCAALEAARAVVGVMAELRRKPTCVHCYSDSKVALGYIFNETRAFSRYVERRTMEIQRHAPASQWHYVNTLDNPADVATRPACPEALFKSHWLQGPKFLQESGFEPEPYVNYSVVLPLPEEVIKVKTMASQCSTARPVHTLFTGDRTFNELVALFTVALRFKHNVVRRQQERAGVPPADLAPYPTRADAIQLAVFTAQGDAYSHIRESLSRNSPIPDRDPISALNPCLDADQLIRVGGRLHHAKVPVAHKHPYLLPKGHPLTAAIINHYHAAIYHQGRHLTHGAIIQHGYFIENGRRIISEVIKSCVTCRRLRGPLASQLMADLPPDRLACTPPFTHTALDVFGPFMITHGQRTRASQGTAKLWAIIFVCLPSRAIHLEPLDSLSTDSFRLALSRFVAVRGVCKTIRSDRGTNFVGAKNQMANVNVEALSHELKRQDIVWTLNPPHASHFGGSWEAKIGAVRRVMNGIFQMSTTTRMSREEFATVLAKAAAVVNDTPLWACPTAPEDPSPLTPSMLITGRDYQGALPPNEFSEETVQGYGPKRFGRVAHLSNLFWRRWRTEYLHTLMKRHKWRKPLPCIAIDDVVLVRDKQAYRGDWPMARVIGVKPGRDGLVREVDLRLAPLRDTTACRFQKRPIHELVLLVPSVQHRCTTTLPPPARGGVVSNPDD